VKRRTRHPERRREVPRSKDRNRVQHLKTAAVAALATLLCAAASSAGTWLHPPAQVMKSLEQLRETDSLGGLPDAIRQGTFTLPDGTNAKGWKLAAPGAAWNSTDSIIDPSSPGRRLIFAANNATICVLHYERGGIALIDLVMSLTRRGDSWRVTWLAYGHPPAKNLDALRELLRNHSALIYHDDPSPHIDY
jgi:hypothetical protein